MRERRWLLATAIGLLAVAAVSFVLAFWVIDPKTNETLDGLGYAVAVVFWVAITLGVLFLFVLGVAAAYRRGGGKNVKPS